MAKKKVFTLVLCVVMLVSSISTLAATVSNGFGLGATAKLTTASNKSNAQAWTTDTQSLDKSTMVKVVDAFGYTNGWSYGEGYAYAGTSGLSNPEMAYSNHTCGYSSTSLSCAFS